MPQVYDRPEDLDYLHKKLYEIYEKFMDPMMTKDLLYEIMEENFKKMREEVYQGDPVVQFASALEERLMKYSSIKPNERYKAIVIVGGIILPPTGEEEKKILHEFIHHLDIMRFPELAIALNYPPAFVPNVNVRVFFSSYFSCLYEAMCYLTTIRMSDVIKIEKYEAFKFFHDSMNKANTIDSKIVTSMLYTILKDKNDFPDPLHVLSKYGKQTLRSVCKELGLKYADDDLLRVIEKIKSDMEFMKTNFDIEVFIMSYNGSLKPLKSF
jgi:hypothetical protein